MPHNTVLALICPLCEKYLDTYSSAYCSCNANFNIDSVFVYRIIDSNEICMILRIGKAALWWDSNRLDSNDMDIKLDCDIEKLKQILKSGIISIFG